MASGVTRRFFALGSVAVLALAGSGCSMDMSDYDYSTLSGQLHKLGPHPESDRCDGVKLLFLPFEGGPVNTLDDIYHEVRDQAEKDKIQLVYGLQEPATYRIRVVMTAVATNTWTTLIHTVDIYDGAGRRVHHFAGQLMCEAGSGDPWSGVKSKYIRLAGIQVETGIQAWLTRRPA